MPLALAVDRLTEARGVTAGVLLEDGAAEGAADLIVTTLAGYAVPSDIEAVAWWPSGCVLGVHVAWRAEPGVSYVLRRLPYRRAISPTGGGGSARLAVTAAGLARTPEITTPTPTVACAVTAGADLVVSNGAGRSWTWYSGEPAPEHGTVYVTDATYGAAHLTTSLSVTVERETTERVIVRVEGTYETAGAEELARGVIRYEIRRGETALRVQTTVIITRDCDDVVLTGCYLDLTGATSVAVRQATERGVNIAGTLVTLNDAPLDYRASAIVPLWESRLTGWTGRMAADYLGIPSATVATEDWGHIGAARSFDVLAAYGAGESVAWWETPPRARQASNVPTAALPTMARAGTSADLDALLTAWLTEHESYWGWAESPYGGWFLWGFQHPQLAQLLESSTRPGETLPYPAWYRNNEMGSYQSPAAMLWAWVHGYGASYCDAALRYIETAVDMAQVHGVDRPATNQKAVARGAWNLGRDYTPAVWANGSASFGEIGGSRSGLAMAALAYLVGCDLRFRDTLAEYVAYTDAKVATADASYPSPATWADYYGWYGLATYGAASEITWGWAWVAATRADSGDRTEWRRRVDHLCRAWASDTEASGQAAWYYYERYWDTTPDHYETPAYKADHKAMALRDAWHLAGASIAEGAWRRTVDAIVLAEDGADVVTCDVWDGETLVFSRTVSRSGGGWSQVGSYQNYAPLLAAARIAEHGATAQAQRVLTYTAQAIPTIAAGYAAIDASNKGSQRVTDHGVGYMSNAMPMAPAWKGAHPVEATDIYWSWVTHSAWSATVGLLSSTE